MKRNYNQMDGGSGGDRDRGGGPVALPIIIKLVCPHDRSGSVIGKGGDVIKSIRTSTGARIKIEDTVPGMKERAITVSALDRPDEQCCPTDEALMRLISRVVELEGPDGEPTPPDEAEVRLIVDRGFVGQIVGKGGSHVSQIRSQTGANINTMPPTMRSPLVADAEQLIKVTGPYEGVKSAVHLIVEKVRIAIAKGQMPLALTNPPPPAAHGQAAAPSAHAPPPYASAPPATGATPPAAQIETVYRILMPDYRVGGLIGKGGEHLRRIRNSTRAEVHVDAKLDGVPERVVVCKSQEPADSQWCGAAEALMKCTQHMLHDKPGSHEGKDGADAAAPPGPKNVRLVAQARQMGSVIGMKGSTIKQLAQDFRCKLNVIKGDLAPGLGTAHDEVLLIEGMPSNILSAVRAVTMLLRNIMVRQQTEQRAPPPPAPLATLPPPPAAAAPAPAPWAPARPAAAAPGPYQPSYAPAPAPYSSAPPSAYTSAPPPPAYGSTAAAPRASAAPPAPTYATSAPLFVPSATPYGAEPSAAGAQRAPLYSAPPPAQAGPVAPAPAAPAAASSDPWAAYAAAVQAAAQQQQQPQQQQQQQQAPLAYAPAPTQAQQPPAYSSAPSAAALPAGASALAAQLYGAGGGTSYQAPQQQQGANGQPLLVMYSNGVTGPAPAAGTLPASSAPPAYTTLAQPQQQQYAQYGQPQQQQQPLAGGFAGYSSYVPSPSPAPAK